MVNNTRNRLRGRRQRDSTRRRDSGLRWLRGMASRSGRTLVVLEGDGGTLEAARRAIPLNRSLLDKVSASKVVQVTRADSVADDRHRGEVAEATPSNTGRIWQKEGISSGRRGPKRAAKFVGGRGKKLIGLAGPSVVTNRRWNRGEAFMVG